VKSSAEEGRSKAEWTVRNLWQFGNELTPGTAVNPHHVTDTILLMSPMMNVDASISTISVNYNLCSEKR
jgi:hypothetical protein